MIDVYNDKRLIPDCTNEFWSERKSEKTWHYCKYCHGNAPTFRLVQGKVGDLAPLLILRCCWQCGAGLDQLMPSLTEKNTEKRDSNE